MNQTNSQHVQNECIYKFRFLFQFEGLSVYLFVCLFVFHMNCAVQIWKTPERFFFRMEKQSNEWKKNLPWLSISSVSFILKQTSYLLLRNVVNFIIVLQIQMLFELFSNFFPLEFGSFYIHWHLSRSKLTKKTWWLVGRYGQVETTLVISYIIEFISRHFNTL